MTPGEKMVWAAAFATHPGISSAGFNEGSVIDAASHAFVAVHRLRRVEELCRNKYAFLSDDAKKQLLEMLHGED